MIACTKCKAPLQRRVVEASGLTNCPSCGVRMQVDVFPAAFRELARGTAGESLLADDEASCFYHPKKKAVIPCEACGRFLCALCDIEFNGRHLCPSCLETGKRKHKIKNLEKHRTLYDSIALALAVYPMLFFWPTLFTAPAACFVGVRYWNAPRSIISRSKVRFIAAFVLAGLQIAGWSGLVYSWITS